MERPSPEHGSGFFFVRIVIILTSGRASRPWLTINKTNNETEVEELTRAMNVFHVPVNPDGSQLKQRPRPVPGVECSAATPFDEDGWSNSHSDTVTICVGGWQGDVEEGRD